MNNHQPDIFSGQAARDTGLNQVANNSQWFVATVRGAMRLKAKRQGRVTIDDARQFAAILDIAPHHRNAWGTIFKGSEWVCVGRTKLKLESNHAREIKVWSLRSTQVRPTSNG